MAEYKKFSCPYGDDFEGGEVCDRCDYYEICMETPTADVIERSKVDKAIEEINQCKVYGHTDCARLVSLPEVLSIIKKNIGE